MELSQLFTEKKNTFFPEEFPTIFYNALGYRTDKLCPKLKDSAEHMLKIDKRDVK